MTRRNANHVPFKSLCNYYTIGKLSQLNKKRLSMLITTSIYKKCPKYIGNASHSRPLEFDKETSRQAAPQRMSQFGHNNMKIHQLFPDKKATSKLVSYYEIGKSRGNASHLYFIQCPKLVL